MLSLVVLLSAFAQEKPIILSHPRPPATYRVTTEIPCGEDGKYVFVVENGGATSQLALSTLNGKPIELKSSAILMRNKVARLKDVSLQPITCLYGAGALILVNGIDTDPSSATLGKHVRVQFQADLKSH
jgi:hypothetical protein